MGQKRMISPRRHDLPLDGAPEQAEMSRDEVIQISSSSYRCSVLGDAGDLQDQP